MICNDRIECNKKASTNSCKRIALEFYATQTINHLRRTERRRSECCLYVLQLHIVYFISVERKKNPTKKPLTVCNNELSFHCITPCIFTFLSGKLLTSQNKAIIMPHLVLSLRWFMIWIRNAATWKIETKEKKQRLPL